MSTEYSRDVDDWQDRRWDHVGVDLMYEFHLKNKQTKKEAKDYGIDIEDYAREKSDENYPMMLYCYPLFSDPSDEKIIAVCRETCCTVVKDRETDDYYLALCGGGMDLRQSIALAYIIAEGFIPHSLAKEVCKQPCLSVGGRQWKRIAKEVKMHLKSEIRSCASEIKSWNRNIKEYDERERKRKEQKAADLQKATA